MKKRHYNNGDGEFILEPLSDSLVKVTHRDQTGYLGMNTEWDARKPFAWTKWRDQTSDDGVNDGFWSYPTPDSALESLCDILLSDQSKEDSRRINPEGRKNAARRVLNEFLEELPD